MKYPTIKRLESREKWTDAKKIVKRLCDCCGYDRATLTHSSYASAGVVECNNPNCESKDYI